MVFISILEISIFISEQSNIAIIGAIAFLYTLKLLSFSKFQPYLHFSDIQTNFTKLAKTLNLYNVSSEYYKFVNVFSKTKVEILTSYYSYNLQINLEEETQSLVGFIYFLLVSEQEILKDFIEQNLNICFIQSTFFPYNILVLFIKKKDGLLYFCINFYSLSCIFKKDHYLVLLISNLLDSFHKAQIYIKIDLCYTYYLVHIANNDKWKTTSRTYYGLFEQFVIPFSLINTLVVFQ